jgi:hypothetical protein
VAKSFFSCVLTHSSRLRIFFSSIECGCHESPQFGPARGKSTVNLGKIDGGWFFSFNTCGLGRKIP